MAERRPGQFGQAWAVVVRVLVLGGEGMLGHQVCRRLGPRFELWATFRDDPANWTGYCGVGADRALGGVDAMVMETVESALDRVRPDAVINCIGIVKQRDEAKMAVPSIAVNSLFPHELADRCVSMGARLLHISTDCVFSGRRGSYTEDDLPDPPDLYGRSKLLGEVDRSGCLTIRTSIIGWEVLGNASLLEWFAAQRGQAIKGFRRVIYTGLSTIAVADIMAWVLDERAGLDGLYQVASKPITKYDLLVGLRDELGWNDIVIEPEDEFASDRSLLARRFAEDAGWVPPDWDEMISGLASQWPTYASWRGLA